MMPQIKLLGLFRRLCSRGRIAGIPKEVFLMEKNSNVNREYYKVLVKTVQRKQWREEMTHFVLIRSMCTCSCMF